MKKTENRYREKKLNLTTTIKRKPPHDNSMRRQKENRKLRKKMKRENRNLAKDKNKTINSKLRKKNYETSQPH